MLVGAVMSHAAYRPVSLGPLLRCVYMAAVFLRCALCVVRMNTRVLG